MDAEHDTMLAREEAVRRVVALRDATLDGRPTESVPIDSIAGRVLAEEIVAPANVPPHDVATMDGFAFAADDGYPLRVADDEVFPEDEPPAIESGEAVRIATGAPLPERADAVLKREEATVEGGRLSGPEIEPGTYAYRRGSNVSAGETLFRAGERLSPKDAILLRDLGIEAVDARTRLSAGVLATGTEIHEGRSADLDSPMLCGLVESWGHEATYEGSVPDEYERVEGRIGELATAHDVVLTTGGTSVGRKDYVVRALAALGEVRFHGVRVRPGKPIAVASLPDHDAVAFAIPGKPIGAHTISSLVVRPFFAGDARLPGLPGTLSRDVGVPAAGFEYAVPVVLENVGGEDGGGKDGGGEDGGGEGGATAEALPLGHVDSPLSIYGDTFDPSVLSQSTRASRADGFFLARDDRRAGETVSVVPYPVVE